MMVRGDHTLVLARVYVQRGKFAEAEPLTAQVLDLARRLPIEGRRSPPACCRSSSSRR